MANTVGPLIKEARGKAKLSQEALASQIEGLSAADLGKAERGEKELPQSVLRQIAKLTGVTQSSLINAAKESTYGTAKKPAASTTEKKTGTGTAKTGTSNAKTGTSTAKTDTSTAKTGTSARKTSTSTKKESAAKDAFTLTAAEKKLVELYREADSETKKKAVALLKGEQSDTGDILTTLLGTAIDMFGKK